MSKCKATIEYETKPWGECFELKVKNTRTHTAYRETKDGVTVWLTPETALKIAEFIDAEVERRCNQAMSVGV